jgi:hypothetical protein
MHSPQSEQYRHRHLVPCEDGIESMDDAKERSKGFGDIMLHFSRKPGGDHHLLEIRKAHGLVRRGRESVNHLNHL